jgi:hypothetical protein
MSLPAIPAIIDLLVEVMKENVETMRLARAQAEENLRAAQVTNCKFLT